MTNLTEQWKKGQLPEGFYFVDDGAEVTIDYYLCDYWERNFDSYVQQVLAPVPSYEEYLESESHCAVYSEENAELKELLKECRDVAEFTKTIVNKHKWLNEVITKIDEALK